MPVIPALRNGRQEFKAILGYIGTAVSALDTGDPFPKIQQQKPKAKLRMPGRDSQKSLQSGKENGSQKGSLENTSLESGYERLLH